MRVFTGPIVLVGYGSIGRGVLALLEKNLEFKPDQVTIIEPNLLQLERGSGKNYRHITTGLTPSTYTAVLDGILGQSNDQALIINLAIEVSSVALITYAARVNALYIDTVVEPWPGVYDDFSRPAHTRTNFFLREELLALRKTLGPSSPTAVSCCGANPGMVSWLTKRALLHIAKEINHEVATPATKADWALLAEKLGIKGIHIAERDDQTTTRPVPQNQFVNTWSVEGLISEALQPAELGWGTHEINFPSDAQTHPQNDACGIFLDSYGAKTKVATWTPNHGAITGFVVTHNEALSLSDYFTVRNETGTVRYRPTVHYAYHPSDLTVSCLETLVTEGRSAFTDFHVLAEDEITHGYDELGVLLFGHDKNAYWYGSRLSTTEAKELAPYQNATGLQVSSAVYAGICWMLENRTEGIVEAEEMDHEYCLSIQEPYLGRLFGVYTDWQPKKKDGTTPGTWQFTDLREA